MGAWVSGGKSGQAEGQAEGQRGRQPEWGALAVAHREGKEVLRHEIAGGGNSVGGTAERGLPRVGCRHSIDDSTRGSE